MILDHSCLTYRRFKNLKSLVEYNFNANHQQCVNLLSDQRQWQRRRLEQLIDITIAQINRSLHNRYYLCVRFSHSHPLGWAMPQLSRVANERVTKSSSEIIYTVSWLDPGSNRGPSVCNTDAITNYAIEPVERGSRLYHIQRLPKRVL